VLVAEEVEEKRRMRGTEGRSMVVAVGKRREEEREGKIERMMDKLKEKDKSREGKNRSGARGNTFVKLEKTAATADEN
jgi:hypothetical protein